MATPNSKITEQESFIAHKLDELLLFILLLLCFVFLIAVFLKAAFLRERLVAKLAANFFSLATIDLLAHRFLC